MTEYYCVLKMAWLYILEYLQYMTKKVLVHKNHLLNEVINETHSINQKGAKSLHTHIPSSHRNLNGNSAHARSKHNGWHTGVKLT